MTAEEFLSDLARQNLVPAEIIESLRRQVAKSAKPVAPQTLAKLLVDKGHLTAVQSQRLLGAAPAPAAAKKPAPAALEPLGPADDLGLTPLDDLLTPLPPEPAAAPAKPAAAPAKPAAKAASPAKPAAAAPVKSAAALDDLGLTPLDDLLTPDPAPAKPAAPTPTKPTAPAKSPAASAPAAKAKAPAPMQELQALDDLEPLGEAAPLDLSSGGDLFGAPAPAGVGAASADPFAQASTAAVADPFAQPVAMTTAAGAPAAAPAKPAKKSSGVVGLVIGLVVVLVIASGTAAAFILIPRDTGEKDFAAAEQDYQAKQFAAAIEKYDAALTRYPYSPEAGLAKVRRALAKILTASSSQTDWPAILPVAKEVLPPIAAQPELTQVHDQLAPLLTDMADGLTTLAAKARSADEAATRLAQAKDALALSSDARFVPGSLRQWQRLASAEETLAVVEYTAKRASVLDAAVAKIKAAATSGKPDGAYAERSQLLLSYPDLATSAALRDAFQQVAQAEAARVTSGEEKSAAETTETNPAIVASLAFAAPISAAPAGAPGRKFIAAATGSVWAFDGPTGQLLWRRPAGGSSSAGPVPVSADAASDVLIVDNDHLLRVAGATGAIVWRRQFDSPLAGAPVVAGAQVVATTRSGRVVKLEAATGNVAAAVQLPPTCRVSAVVSADGNHVYQLADHSNLYALSAADLSCAGVVYVGHEPASVATPPLVVGRHLVIADNSGAADATLQVVALKDDGLPQGVVQRVEIPGLVLTPPSVLGKHLVVITDRGDNVALRITTEKSAPLERLNETGSSAVSSQVRFGLALGEKLIVAGDGLRLDALDAASGSFQATWTAFSGEALLGPPQQSGDVLFCLRRDTLAVGVIATAVQASTGKPLWQTRIAVQLATGPLVDAGGQSAAAITVLGNSTNIDLANWRGPAVQAFPLPTAGQPSLPPIADCLRLPSGAIVLAPAGGTSQLLILPADGTAARGFPLPGTLAAKPVALGGGVLVACSSGDVVLLNPLAGAPQADPLQAALAPGPAVSRGSLDAAGENAAVAVYGDGQLTLRQIGLETAPQPRLVEQATAKLAAPMISTVAVLGQSAFVVDESGALRSFALPGLAPGPSFKLEAAAIVLGPLRVGSRVVVATDRDELWCFAGESKQLWKIPLSHGPLAGSPVEAAGSLVIATKGGALVRVDADTGKETAVLDLGQALAGTPAVSGQFVLVPAADGTLLTVTLPKAAAQAQKGAASP